MPVEFLHLKKAAIRLCTPTPNKFGIRESRENCDFSSPFDYNKGNTPSSNLFGIPHGLYGPPSEQGSNGIEESANPPVEQNNPAADDSLQADCLFHEVLGSTCPMLKTMDQWRTHVLSHFQGIGFPNQATCVYCDMEITVRFGDNAEARWCISLMSSST